MFDRRSIQETYLRTSRKVKDFLLSEKSREFFVFLFFFCIAGGYWLLQTLNNDYETEFSIPVRLKGVPDQVVITSEPAAGLRIRVKDKGTVLLNYMLGKSFYPVTFNFNDYKNSNDHVLIHAPEITKKVSAQLNASTNLLSVKPDTLEYYYSKGNSKRVPVKLSGTVNAGRQYYIADTVFSPDSVLVYAPDESINAVTAAYTVPVNIENLEDTLRRQVALRARKGLKFAPATVDLMLPVDIYTEKTVEVPLQGIGFPADKVLRAFPSKVQITFQVGMSHFLQVTENDFHLFAAYEELLELGSEKYTVKLQSLPQGVTQVHFNPEQVDFLIEQIPSAGGEQP